MKKISKSNQRAVMSAAVATSVMMLVFGVGYRVIAARLASLEGIKAMAPDALEPIPMQIGDWTGVDMPLDETIIEATDTDAHICRNYSRYNNTERVWLYIAGGARARDLMPHRPEVCYIGGGWTRVDNHTTELLLIDGKVIPCSIFQFTKGDLISKNVVVLDYYIVDGLFSQDVSLLRWQIWRGSGAINYVAQVQVVASVTADHAAESVKTMITDFAIESALPILNVFNSINNGGDTDTSIQQADTYSGEPAGD